MSAFRPALFTFRKARSNRAAFAFGYLAGALCFLNAAAHAQTPVLDAPPVEKWVGLHRVDVAGPPPTKTLVPEERETPRTAIEPAPLPATKNETAPNPPSFVAPPIYVEVNLPPSAFPLAPPVSPVVQASARLDDAPAPQPREPAPKATVAIQPTSAGAAAPATPHADEANAVHPSPSQQENSLEANTLIRTAAGPFLGTLAALGVALMLCLVGLLLFGRRRKAASEPSCVRVELVNLPASLALVAPAAKQEAAPPAAPAEEAAPPPTFETLLPESEKAFDLGPTYEEEQQMKEDARRMQEEAVLRQVLEQNLDLRRRLSDVVLVTA